MDRSIFAALAWAVAALGSSVPPNEPSPASADLAGRVQAIADAVLAHHIDPPSRQQMVLDGLKAVHAAAGMPPPAGLARRVSAVATPEQLAALLVETWPDPGGEDVSRADLEAALLQGMLASVPGDASLVSAPDLKVEEQIEGNLYVGIHVALGYDGKEKRPQIAQVFEGGPADRAGARGGDLIEAIDGVSTEGLDLRKAVKRLRGPEGTEVVVRVRRPGPGDVLTLTMTRGRLPRQTVTGIRKRPDGAWDVRFDGPEPIGFLRVGEISGSTPQELRQMARQLEAEGIRALVLDLRLTSRAGFHPTVLLADSLLDGGAIGRVRTAAAVTPYAAEPDALFRDWPLAVLVDGSTSGAAEWLVAALQDNHRAVIVGTRTGGEADVESTVPLPGGEWSIRMTTGRLERGDGRPLAGPSRAPGRRLVTPTRPGSIANVGGGVIPDFPVEAPATDLERRLRAQKGPRTSEAEGQAPDPVLTQARQRLVEAMKASAP